jgi:hypothetical protein
VEGVVDNHDSYSDQNYKISKGRKKKEGSWDQLTGNKEQR